MSESQIQSTVQKEHTSPAQYVLVGGVLVGLTAMEISLYYMERHINRGILMVGLYGVAAIKFFLVAAFFMQLLHYLLLCSSHYQYKIIVFSKFI